MIHEQETEVLVVGAGPVGMLTALLLAENNIAVRIIDREPGPARHSYACGLHPASLQVLERVGLLPAVLHRGRRLHQVALYEGAQRQAELRFSDLSSAHPYLVALPQNELETLLAEKLRATHRTRVEWDHRLSELAPEGDDDRDDLAAAIVCKLGETSAGYSVPVLERAVQKTLRIRAAAVVGADGHASCVRQELGLGWERVGIPEFFAVYDFQTERPVPDEVRIVFDQGAVSAMWPLPDNRCRWCLQVAPFELSRDCENKDREAFLLVADALDISHRQHVEQMIRRRAPWFESGVRELDWSAGARFEGSVVAHFGRGRCWLAGDAAHQGSPIGMQGMNAGLQEAETLADILKRVVRQEQPWSLLETYEAQSRAEWNRAVGVESGSSLSSQAPRWVRSQPERLLSCLPASGPELAQLADQLQIPRFIQMANH